MTNHNSFLTTIAMALGLLSFTPAFADAGPMSISIALADILPLGYRAINHELVFVESDVFDSHQVIATPIRGFHGIEQIRPGKPFRFSSKYGTRIYVLPAGVALPTGSNGLAKLQWPGADPPVQEIGGVPWYSPVASARTTCRLASIDTNGVTIELVDHVEMDASGKPVSFLRRILFFATLSAVGLIGCIVLLLRRRTRIAHRSPETSSQAMS